MAEVYQMSSFSATKTVDVKDTTIYIPMNATALIRTGFEAALSKSVSVEETPNPFLQPAIQPAAEIANAVPDGGETTVFDAPESVEINPMPMAQDPIVPFLETAPIDAVEIVSPISDGVQAPIMENPVIEAVAQEPVVPSSFGTTTDADYKNDPDVKALRDTFDKIREETNIAEQAAVEAVITAKMRGKMAEEKLEKVRDQMIASKPQEVQQQTDEFVKTLTPDLPMAA